MLLTHYAGTRVAVTQLNAYLTTHDAASAVFATGTVETRPPVVAGLVKARLAAKWTVVCVLAWLVD